MTPDQDLKPERLMVIERRLYLAVRSMWLHWFELMPEHLNQFVRLIECLNIAQQA